MGNSMPYISTEVFRKDHRVILARNRKYASLVPIVLEYDATGYYAGQVIARNTTSELWTKYVAAGSSGTDTAVGILFNDVLDMPASAVGGGDLIVRGEVYQDNCLDLDSDAITDLGGRSVVSGTGSTILIF